MGAKRVVSRIGLSSQVPPLRPGEMGYDTDTKVFRVGDDTADAPKVLTDKTTSFDLSNLTDLTLSEEVLDLFAKRGVDGWSPVIKTETSGQRELLVVKDWIGDGLSEDKPPFPVYIGSNGFTEDSNLATDIRGRKGDDASGPVISFSMENGILVMTVLNKDETQAPIEGVIDENGHLILEYEATNNTSVYTDLGKVLVTFKGNYSNSATYYALDEVIYSEGLYRVNYDVTSVTGINPSDTDYWSVVFQKIALTWSATVDDISGRGVYDSEPEGFSVLVLDTGNTTSAVYFRVGVAGNWSNPLYITSNPGLVWIDAGWSSGTSYYRNDALENGGSSYRCIVDHVSAANTEPGVGVNWEDNWALIAYSGDITSHINDHNNPHSVTKAQLGLANVDNTSDLDKPISTATQNALNDKFATPVGNTSQYVRGNGSLGNISVFATSAQGAKADTALQPEDIGDLEGLEYTENKGVPGGYAPLDAEGLIPEEFLPIMPGTIEVLRFNGDGVETEFDLEIEYAVTELTNVFINGVYQQKDSYAVIDGILTFSEAPEIDHVIEVNVRTADPESYPSNFVLNADNHIDGITKVVMTTAERTKLSNAELISNKGEADGYAPLDSNSLIPEEFIPPTTISLKRFTGDGTTVAFDLEDVNTTTNLTTVYINGLYQQKDTYSISGGILTLDSAPANHHTIEVLYNQRRLGELPAYLEVSNNLSDIDDTDSARENLREYKTVQDLLASTRTGGGVGTRWRAGGFDYEEAAPDAVDFHIETMGGVKLYALVGSQGEINIGQLGIAGDGVTNVTAVFNLANTISKLIIVPQGEFVLSLFFPQAGTTMRGAGMGATIIKALGSVNAHPIAIYNDYITIEDFTIDGNGTVMPPPGSGDGAFCYIAFNCFGTIVRRIELLNAYNKMSAAISVRKFLMEDCIVDGGGVLNHNQDGIQLYGGTLTDCTDIIIRRNHFKGNVRGAVFADTSVYDVLIEDNIFDNYTTTEGSSTAVLAMIFSSRITIRKNTFRRFKYCVRLRCGVGDVLIEDNTMLECLSAPVVITGEVTTFNFVNDNPDVNHKPITRIINGELHYVLAGNIVWRDCRVTFGDKEGNLIEPSTACALMFISAFYNADKRSVMDSITIENIDVSTATVQPNRAIYVVLHPTNDVGPELVVRSVKLRSVTPLLFHVLSTQGPRTIEFSDCWLEGLTTTTPLVATDEIMFARNKIKEFRKGLAVGAFSGMNAGTVRAHDNLIYATDTNMSAFIITPGVSEKPNNAYYLSGNRYTSGGGVGIYEGSGHNIPLLHEVTTNGVRRFIWIDNTGAMRAISSTPPATYTSGTLI